MIDLERDWTPPPQSSEQVAQADQPETLQSMGQAKVWQLLITLVTGQARPPFLVAVMMERVVYLVPVAQVAEQAVYLANWETLQSMGQAKVLQDLESRVETQATPP